MTRQTVRLVGVRFTRSGPVRYFNAGSMELALLDRVVAVTEQREQVGTVVITPQQAIHSELGAALQPVLRKATPEDEAKENGPRP